MPHLPSLPDDSTLANVFKQFPSTSVPLMHYSEAVMRGESALTAAERELIAAYVSGLNRCGYCHGVHAQIAEDFGVAEGLLATLITDIDSANVSDKLKPILRLAKKLTENPSRVAVADTDAVLAAGWDEKGLHDAISVCALFNFFNRLVDGLGLPGEEEVVRPRGKVLGQLGYVGVIEKLGLGG
jgi:uncharacterized peroxidase-related enzyme